MFIGKDCVGALGLTSLMEIFLAASYEHRLILLFHSLHHVFILPVETELFLHETAKMAPLFTTPGYISFK